MAILKEIVARAGTYTNKEGQEKTRYVKAGVLMETAKGQMVKLEALPVGFDGWLYFQDMQRKEAGQPAIKGGAEIESDIPF
jgi:hypothetical protein